MTYQKVRETFKGGLPIKMLQPKCLKVHSELLNQQSEPIPEEQRLMFGKHWNQDWIFF